MKRVYWQKRMRKWHRYLGVVFGIQFLFWTIGGIYFSWTNIKTVRGDDVRQDLPLLSGQEAVVSPSLALRQLRAAHPHAELLQIQLCADIYGKPIYLVRYHEHHQEHHMKADALTGSPLPAVSRDDAMDIAMRSVNGRNTVLAVNRITSTGGHHEYREKPLPAFAVTLQGDANATVYVGEETGIVHSVRNNQWRVFDFLWMLHVMDFKTRDDINNWLLRILSVAGFITLCSGYALFFLSRKRSLKKV